ncbi:transcriptional regulator GlxA family with amidase domain [Pseudomonas sp. WPR_5_2]|uniref:GlxA family transcriptional regulator n=1 Tax=Pseudomonas sp. WPR_5_2 TaxID=1907371 RepID=UPI000EB4F703|nr:helix-turn-helix domain-containing protein [Pseudomonas sp. WPR_5_2]RKS27544.1 transcriptional regulator GlxA family with amidase domain [Pseudomonas sp. WPR_5_2]
MASSVPDVSDRPLPPVLRIGFWLMEAFDLYALANALEPLRLANQMAGRSVCQWQMLSLGGQSLSASNGIATATARLDQAQTFDVLILCGGDSLHLHPDLRAQLNHWATQPICLGALGEAGWLLAQIGALEGVRCSLPEPATALTSAALSELTPVAAPFCVDRQRLTCVGPQAVQGLMHELLARTHGRGLILRMEKHAARQARPLLPLNDAPAKLQATLALMNEHLRRTLGIDELAGSMGISRRHLERLFKRSLGCSPSRHYLDLRLQRARQLLRAGGQSLSDVATACGFVSLQHFFRCYRQYFGEHPREHMGAQAQSQRASLLNAPASSRAGSLPH